MSYSIAHVERKFAELYESERKKGWSRLFPYYDSIRKHNGSIVLNNPNINKILEYCCYSHDLDQIPIDLQPLRNEVKNFFQSLYGNITSITDKKNLFVHIIMRECNKKEMPISQTAIKNVYALTFNETLDNKTLRWVSNYCGLYYTERSPYDYLIDTDRFDSIFQNENENENDESSVTDDETESESVVDFYTFLNPKGMENKLTPSALKSVVLCCISKHFNKEPFTADQLIKSLCSDYGIEENIWGMYLNYNKTTLRDKVLQATYALRKAKLLKKGSNKTNSLTSKGLTEYNKILKKYKETQNVIVAEGVLKFNSGYLQSDEEGIHFVWKYAKSLQIKDAYDGDDNDVSNIVLVSHYLINYEASKESPVQVSFPKLIDYICDFWGVDVLCWGMYRNTNRPSLKKQCSQHKSRLFEKGFLLKGKNGAGILSQKGIEFIETQVFGYSNTSDNTNSPTESESPNNSPEFENLLENLGFSTPNNKEEDMNKDPELIEDDFNPIHFTAETNLEIVETETSNIISLETAEVEEPKEEIDYDQYLKNTLKENDVLQEKSDDLKATVNNLIDFLKQRDLLAEYIIYVSKKNTEIPF